MRKGILKIGTVYGDFTLIGESENKLHARPTWRLKCKCGTVVLKTTSDVGKLVSTSNCGCDGRQRSRKELSVGQRFGKLTIIKALRSDKHGKQQWSCLCDCGNICVKITSGLKQGKIPSCGCHVNIKHGGSRSSLYSTWEAMHQRCYNPESECFEYYGGRGITVCEEWKDFATFAQDMGERPKGFVIDRIDTNGSYEKDNCRWTTRSESSYNTRKQKNNTSGRTGVVLDRRSNIWYARIDYKGKSIHLGSSGTFEGACKLREAAELFYFGYIKE